MGVMQYSLKADGEKVLSKNFKVKEFRCKDGSDKILVSTETVAKLQAAADYFGKPIYINSAYRTPSWNIKQGGSSKSQHVVGTACDIRIDGVPSKAVTAFFEAHYPNSGIGLYNTFTHIDSRGRKSYWKDTGSNTVSSFKLGDIYTTYKKKEDDMTEAQVNAAADAAIIKYFDMLKIQKPSAWSADARSFVENNGIIKGDANGDKKYKMYVTREELAEVLKEFYNLIKK